MRKLKDEMAFKLSYLNIKTDMPVVVRDLTSRLMVMLIFDYF